MTKDNRIPHPLWKVTLRFSRTLSGELPERLSDALEDLAVAVLLHNKEAADGDDWEVSLTTMGKPDTGEIYRRICAVGAGLIEENGIVAEKLPEKDWLRHVHENFPPVAAGRFFIYGSHYAGEKPEGRVPLQIDAATAFGSGEHETTRGCLLALEKLRESPAFKNAPDINVLDMGCGSGILAIATTKLWPQAKVAAVDIDPESITVAGRHAEMNAAKIACMAGDGYRTPLAQENAPYDIVTANILANPLIEMAPDLARVLKPGGFAVLSGLLRRQRDEVVAAHEKAGLFLVHAEEIGAKETEKWQALVMQKRG